MILKKRSRPSRALYSTPSNSQSLVPTPATTNEEPRAYRPPSHLTTTCTQHTQVQHQHTNAFPFMQGAISMSVSRQTVVYDGQNTHVEAEQQSYVNGQWTRTHAQGTWEGDQSRKAILGLTRK